MSRLLAVSDIHGHGHLLEQLLVASGYNSERDRLVLLGDYVNKGPDSWGTLQLVHELTRKGAVALQGNNERKWLRSMPDSIPASIDEITYVRKFLDQMPLWHTCDSYLFVHAGIRPGIPLDLQTAEDLTEIRQPFFESPVNPEYTIVFGHTSTYRFLVPPWQIWVGAGKMGIDTGAGHGYYVSLIDLTHRLQWYVSVHSPSIIRCTVIPGSSDLEDKSIYS